MEDLSLHMLDIMENSIDAGAHRIEVRIDEDPERDLLTLDFKDDGRGMDAQTLQRATDPFFTTRKTRSVGLGLSMLSESAKATGGTMIVESSPGEGTRVRATFRPGHIDMKPLGDIPQTLLTLIAGHPEIELRYDHAIAGETFTFDTRELRDELGPLPAAAAWRIGERIRKGLEQLARRAKHTGG